jgi:uncharacterized phage protein (TIGR01671 family)
MREIEFRGKRTDTGEWVYGSLYHAKFWQTGNVLYKITPYEDNGESYHVYPESIGQYTGLKDRNGVKIFEGDIVNFLLPYHKESTIGAVFFDDSFYSFRIRGNDRYLQNLAPLERTDVIGNIHDNPELLEAGKA